MKRGIACTFDRALPATTKDDKLGSDGQATAADADMAEGINHNLAADRDIEKDACCARTCLKSILKAVSVPAYRGLVCDTPPPSEDLKAWIASCSAHYFGTFHERWTNIVHAPSFDQTTDDAFVVGSVLVIGAWLWDRENLGELVLDIHNRLVHRLLSLIVSTFAFLCKLYLLTVPRLRLHGTPVTRSLGRGSCTRRLCCRSSSPLRQE